MKRIIYALALLAGSAWGQPVATPTFKMSSGRFLYPTAVAISPSTTGATLCYTSDGSIPAATSSCTHGTPLASGGTVTVSAAETLQAIGILSGSANSAVDRQSAAQRKIGD